MIDNYCYGIPHKVLFSGASLGAIQLYAFFLPFWNGKGECFCSNKFIADEMGITVREVQFRFTELENFKCIKRVDKDGQRFIERNDAYLKNGVNESFTGDEQNVHGGMNEPFMGGMNEPFTPSASTNIKNNEKEKEKKIKKETPPVVNQPTRPDFLPEKTWNAFLEHRKFIKKPMSLHAQEVMFKKLQVLWEAGEDIVACIENSIMNGWQGIFPEKQSKPSSSRRYENDGFDPNNPF